MPRVEPTQGMTIGKVAKQAGIGVETVRFYEREGLLAKAGRRASGYRIFFPDVIRRIEFIKNAQKLGFSLTEIRELLSLGTERNGKVLKERIDIQLQEVGERLDDLARMRKALQQLSKGSKGRGLTGDAPLLELFYRS